MIVCEPATVKPPSKSADGVNVAVPVTVIPSPDALPKVTLPFKVVAPSTFSDESKSTASCAFRVPFITVLPEPAVTANLSELTVKFPVDSNVPETSALPFISIVVPLISTSLSDTKSKTPSAD